MSVNTAAPSPFCLKNIFSSLIVPVGKILYSENFSTKGINIFKAFDRFADIFSGKIHGLGRRDSGFVGCLLLVHVIPQPGFS